LTPKGDYISQIARAPQERSTPNSCQEPGTMKGMKDMKTSWILSTRLPLAFQREAVKQVKAYGWEAQ
jgi:hypothetical protein